MHGCARAISITTLYSTNFWVNFVIDNVNDVPLDTGTYIYN